MRGLLLGIGCAALTAALTWQITLTASGQRDIAEWHAVLARQHQAVRSATTHAADATTQAGRGSPPAAISSGSPEIDGAIRTLLARVNALQQWFSSHPDLTIPQVKYVEHAAWFEVAAKSDDDSPDAFRRMAAEIRNRGQEAVCRRLPPVLAAFAKATKGLLPSTVSQLEPFLDPPVGPAALSGFELLAHGSAASAIAKNYALGTSAALVVDPTYDNAVYYAGLDGWTSASDERSGQALHLIAFGEARAAYANEHGGNVVDDARTLAPYFRNPADATAAIQDQDLQVELAAELVRRMQAHQQTAAAAKK